MFRQLERQRRIDPAILVVVVVALEARGLEAAALAEVLLPKTNRNLS